MKKASISEAKNGLSSLIDRVRRGDTVVIEDRGVPVARLEPIVAGVDPEGRHARLARQGVVTAPTRPLSDKWLKAPPPRLVPGRNASDIVISEREDGR